MPQYTHPIDTSGPLLETLDYEGLVTLYAVLCMFDGERWDYAHKHDAHDDPAVTALRKDIEAQQASIREVLLRKFRGHLHLVEIRGYCEDHNVSHYDIDEALREEFGSEVSTDSESGQFFAECTEAAQVRVEAFLKTHFPALVFDMEVIEAGDPMAEYRHAPVEIGARHRNQKWLADRGISTVITMPKLSPKSPQEVARLLSEARKLLEQTGLEYKVAHALLAIDRDTV